MAFDPVLAWWHDPHANAGIGNPPEKSKPAPAPIHNVQSAGANVEQWRDLVSRYFQDADRALGVMRCESGGNPYAHNTRGLDDSVGLYQINLEGSLLAPRAAKLREWGYAAHDRESTIAVLMDPEANVRFAAYMSGGGANWSAWSCGR